MVVSKFIYSFDMFAAVPGFRVRGQSEVASICGGIVSIILLCFFVYVFVEDSVKIINYQKIQASLATKRDRSQTDQINDVMFAIGLQDFSFAEMNSYLSFTAFMTTRNGSTFQDVQIELVRCEKDMWTDLGDQTDTYFENYDISDMLCPASGQDVVLSGIDSHEVQKFVYVMVTDCVNTTGTCLDVFSIQTYLTNYITQNLYIVAQFLYLNTGFNINDEVPITRFVDTDIWLTFTALRGTEAFLEIGTYEIVSDVSVLPWYIEEVLEGSYIANFKSAAFQNSGSNIFCQVFIQMSPESREFQRKYGKIDDSLSYVGGLFGLIIAGLAFFVASYNQYRYELFVGEGAFNLKNGTKMTEDQFHIGHYIAYSIFDWIKLLCCCCEPDWEHCKKIQEARDQANQQIDVRYLLRRISHLEELNKLRYTPEEDMVMFLSECQNIETVRKRRKILEYYDEVMKGKNHITLNTIQTTKTILDFTTTTALNFEQSGRQGFPFFGEEMVNNPKQEPDTVDSILKKHEAFLERENQSVELDQDMLDFERQLSEMYSKLPPKSQKQMMKSIPLLVLYRLRKYEHKEKEEKLEALSKLGKLKIFPVQ